MGGPWRRRSAGSRHLDEVFAGSRRRRRAIVLLAALAAATGVAVLAVVLAFRQYDDSKDRARSDLRARAILAATVFDTYFNGAISTLRSVAASPSVTSEDIPAMRAYFARVQPRNGTLFPGGVGWIDSAGVSRASSTGRTVSSLTNFADRSYFKQVMTTGRPFVSEGLTSRVTHKHVLVLAVPTHDGNGRPSGVLTGALVLRPSKENARTVDLGYEGLQVIDRKGQQVTLADLSRPRNSALVRRLRGGREGVLDSVDGLDGAANHVVAYATSTLPGWKIVIDQSASTTFAAARRALAEELGAIVAALLLVLGIITWASRRARRDERAEQARIQRWTALTASLGSAADVASVGGALARAVAGEVPHAQVIFAVSSDRGALEPVGAARGESASTSLPDDVALRLVEAVAPGEDEDSVSYGTARQLEKRLPKDEVVPEGLRSVYLERLRDREHTAVGTLAVLSSRERALDGRDRHVVRAYADQAAQALNRARRQELDHDTAVVLQRSLLPAELPRGEGFAIAPRYQAGGPGVEIGGDWYDAVRRPDGYLQLTIGDVAGRGIDAAVLMGQLRHAFRAYALEYRDPWAILASMERHVEAGEMATMVCIAIDPYTRELSYASAGHLPPLLAGAQTGVVRLDRPGSTPLGWSRGDLSSLAGEAELLPDDATVILYTDGLIERRGVDIEDGIGLLSSVLAQRASEPVEALADALVTAATATGGGADDAALLVTRLGPVPARVDIELPARPELLADLRRRLRAWMTLRGISKDHAEDAVLVLTEASSNAIEHGYRNASGVVTLSLEHDGETLSMTVEDRGAWRPPVSDSTRGRGLVIMRNLMRNVDVTHGSGGTRVQLEQALR